MSRRTSCRKNTISEIPGERVRRTATVDTCYVEGDRATRTCGHRSDSNVGSGKRKVDHHSTRTDHQDMTGSRINTSVIVSCQNYEVGSRTRIGMRRQTATITTVNVVRTITEIPVVVIVEATSSIENSRTTRSHSSIRHKIQPRR